MFVRRGAGKMRHEDRGDERMGWQTDYQAKLQTAEHAVASVQSSMRVYIQPGCGEPEALVRALLKRAPFVRDVEIVHLLTLGCADYVAPEMAGPFRPNAVFIFVTSSGCPRPATPSPTPPSMRL